MSKHRKKIPLIRYTSRDFDSIKRELSDYRRRYYSDISRDENQASFDEMMLDTVAYVGDVLSFYLDYSVNETFLDTAIEYNNIVKLGKQLGYKFKGNPSSFGIATFYAIFPANVTGLGPDERYLFNLKRGSEFNSVIGSGFILNEDVDFANPSNERVVARVDDATGIPTAYAVKAYGQLISGRIIEEFVPVGNFEEFLRIRLSANNISEVLSVIDSEGNEYFEVDYLSQDVVYRTITNRDPETNALAPSLLRPFVVPRRYVVEQEAAATYLQFGFGSERDVTTEPLIDPATVILEIFGKDYVTDSSFDPSKLLGTDKMGIAPGNTNLRVVYRTNNSDNVNASVNSITEVSNPIIQFRDITVLSQDLIRSVSDSLEITNEEPVVGDIASPTVEELKKRVFDSFGTQNRAVTLKDYRSFVYQMPPNLGAVKRVNIIQDPDSFKRNLNMYVISENSDGTLVRTNSTIKENLRVWLNQGRMINDSIDIIDAKIVNIGIDFIVVGEMEENRFDILSDAITTLQASYINKFNIGEPFFITDIYNILNNVDGVVDTTKVRISVRRGSNYSDTRFDLDKATSPDGRMIVVPDNVIFEIKFPLVDIKGSIK